MKMKKTLMAILAAAMLALPMNVRADEVVKPYCGLVEHVETEYNTTILKCDGENGAFIPERAVEYTELKDTEYGQRSRLVKRVIDYNGDGIFNGQDYYIDIKTKESKGKDTFKGQKILNELKKYFKKPALC